MNHNNMKPTNQLKRKRRREHRSLNAGLSHTGREERLRKAASSSVLDLVCKRRRTLAWQSSAEFPPAPLNPRVEQPAALAQLRSQQGTADSTTEVGKGISKVLQTLRALTAGLSCKDKSACDAAVLTMKRFPYCLPLQTEGCHTIRRYVKATASLTPESLSALLLALTTHAGSDLGSSYLHYLAIDCLRVASRDETGRLLMAEQDGCIEMILRTLGSSLKDPRLQELGLSLISYLVEEDVCRKQIIEHGGVNIMVSSMKNHATNALIQCNASAALGWLVHLEHVDAKAALLATVDAIQTILDISKRYVENASVFGNCICILCGVRVGDRAVAETYPELGSPTRRLLQLGMHKNPKTLKVQRNCMMLLRLTTESEGETGALDDTEKNSYGDCIDVVVACMKEFPNESEIQSFGCRVLCNLAFNPGSRALVMAKDGCINQVVSALDKHKADAGVLQGACWFLQAMLHAGVGQPGATAFGGGLSVLGLMLKGLGVKVVNPVGN